MSDLLFSTRLRWDGRHGVAKLRGYSVDLHEAPQILGTPVAEIDYVPEIRAVSIMPKYAGWREMTTEEIKAADALLVEIANPSARIGFIRS